MTLEEFKTSAAEDAMPQSDLSEALKALWFDAHGDWEMAHDLSQKAGNKDGDWVHAYLHRVEGDLSNAGYWYSRSGKPRFEGSLQEEWAAIATELLEG